MGPTFARSDLSTPLSGFPFLLKVISVGKPLSLQVHPDKYSAVTLHKSNPSSYPDPNPKPEILIATTPFKALCGFLPRDTVVSNLKGTVISGYSFKDVVYAPETLITTAVTTLRKTSPVVSLLASVYGENDPAVLAPLFMNYVELLPGEALVIPPLEPHCYISGEGVECMVPSDNVIRVGLTTKHCDKDMFFSITNKYPRQPTTIKPSSHGECTYYHKCLNFKLHRLVNGSSLSGQGILLILDGKGQLGNINTQHGDSWYIPPQFCANLVGLTAILVTSESQFSLSAGEKSSSTTTTCCGGS